ncbi:MAG: alpha hydrolase [Methanomicrobiales archaeon]|nr:alpha hydrolase [Methanomicrobiales archaeon]NYT21136.1 alpha hydrolase [Methanomicrobiales archaeon]
MKAGVLFSGGKDSALAAVLLSRDYEVELNTFVFSPGQEPVAARTAAGILGFPWKKRVFEEGFLERIADMVVACGYPNEAILEVHRHALATLSREYPVVADGTRMDDRVPVLSRDEVRSFQDRTGCSYIRPLLGYGWREVHRLAARNFVTATGETGTVENGDYERWIREALRDRGLDALSFFPRDHRQSVVLGRAPESGVNAYE